MLKKVAPVSRFQSMEKFKIGDAELRKWTRGVSTFVANLEEGARLVNWNLRMGDGDVRDVVYWPEGAPLAGANFPEARGGNPILFPFAGASFADGNKGFWKTPDGDVLPMKMHGYANDGKFESVSENDYGFTAKFLPSEECKKAYPFDYDFFVTYRFDEFSFVCDLCLKNLGNSEIPWGAGFHACYMLPWHKGLTRSSYRILNDAKKAFGIDSKGKLFPKDISQSENFDNPDLVNKIFTNLKTSEIRFGPKNGEEDLLVKINGGGRTEPGVCVVAWSESEDAPYYCVEPWLAHPNCVSDKKQMRFVPAFGEAHFEMEVSFA